MYVACYRCCCTRCWRGRVHGLPRRAALCGRARVCSERPVQSRAVCVCVLAHVCSRTCAWVAHSTCPCLCGTVAAHVPFRPVDSRAAANSCEDQALQGRRQVQDPLQPGTRVRIALLWRHGGPVAWARDLWCGVKRVCCRCSTLTLAPACQPQYLYTLCVKENEKAEKLTQSLPPGTLRVSISCAR